MTSPGSAIPGSDDALTPGGPDPRRALAGLRVVVTRPRSQAARLVDALISLGAEVIEFPAIRIVPPADPAALSRAARAIGGYDWVVFTSANGVERFCAELEAVGVGAAALRNARIACIGPATAAALAERGVAVDVVPPTYVAESVVESLAAAADLRGRRILLPRAAGARAVLPDGLVALGASVDVVEAYQAVPDREGAEDLRRRLAAGEVDVLTFTSSSTVESFVAAMGAAIGRARVAAIGPITAATARRLNLPVHIEAEEHTIPGLVRALVAGAGGSS